MAHKIFWTARRLRELRSKARHLDVTQLSKYFEKPEESVRQALIYAANMQTMRVIKIKEYVHGQLVHIIKLKPGFALNSRAHYSRNVGFNSSDSEMGCE